jgi:Icc-related predicted phosphoesterase
MRVVHFSDWHWNFEKLPAADLYVCSGDMYRDWMMPAKQVRIKQYALVHKFTRGPHPGFRQYLGSPDAPIVCVRGNHDYADLAPLFFEDCNLIHEFIDNEVIEVEGLRITGHRGIPYINGSFSDEIFRADLIDKVRMMADDCDLYVTHYPPADVWDNGYGLEGMLNWFEYNTKNVLHMYGHIHEAGGQVLEHGHVTFSNAATTYNVIEGSPETGWKDVSTP